MCPSDHRSPKNWISWAGPFTSFGGRTGLQQDLISPLPQNLPLLCDSDDAIDVQEMFRRCSGAPPLPSPAWVHPWHMVGLLFHPGAVDLGALGTSPGEGPLWCWRSRGGRLGGTSWDVPLGCLRLQFVLEFYHDTPRWCGFTRAVKVPTPQQPPALARQDWERVWPIPP